ncbi:hypothetical protein GYMLUDRAFT_242881 [Collybiopsis luxurians FD-317 M1]|uniref:Uncharacterized protein n=1 Tax=Collybiopsis luxurians FD-317 M1 TaxID=944289 RepID=A0A0D0BEH9_9AGAR|nr:hypothetical protein GYMLUDRAFT_242881 [Collybiopsis luxurians FD-317 M1]
MSLISRLYDQHHNASFILDSVYTEVVIVDVHASVLLSQRFTSPPIATLNAVYTFGLMADAAVCGFEMVRGDGTSVPGAIKEKTEAKEEYDKAVKDGFTAGLAKEETKDVFTICVGNMLPSETVTINLRLLQPLINDEKNNEVKFVFPCTYTHRYGQLPSLDAGFVTSIYQPFEMNVFVQQASPIQSVSCPSGYPISIAFGLPQSFNTPLPVVNTENASRYPHNYAHVTLKDPFGSLTRDAVLIMSVTDLDSPRCFIEPHPSPNYNTTAMALTFVPKFTVPDLSNSDSNLGMEYLFLIDRSGSMNQQSRMPLVREALVVLLRGLPTKHTTFNLLSFGSRTTKLWESSQLYTQETLNEATEHVDTMTANYGGTKIPEALQIAFSSLSNPLTRPVAVFLLTDGSSWDVQNCIRTVENATQTLVPPQNPVNSEPLNQNAFLRVFTLGIGDGASSDMCDSIARAGHGISIYVREGEEMLGKCARLVRAARTPPVEVEILWPDEEEEPSFVAPQDDDWDVIDHEYTAEAMGEEYVDISPAIPGPVYTLPGPNSLSDPENEPSHANSFLLVPDFDSLPHIQQSPPFLNQLDFFSGTRIQIYAIHSRKYFANRFKSGCVTLRATFVTSGESISMEVPIVDTYHPFDVAGSSSSTAVGPHPIIHILAAKALITDRENKKRPYSLPLPGPSESTSHSHPRPQSRSFDDSNLQTWLKNDIIRLGTTYGLTSKYTSFLAIDRGGGLRDEVVGSWREVESNPQGNIQLSLHRQRRRLYERTHLRPRPLRFDGLNERPSVRKEEGDAVPAAFKLNLVGGTLPLSYPRYDASSKGTQYLRRPETTRQLRLRATPGGNPQTGGTAALSDIKQMQMDLSTMSGGERISFLARLQQFDGSFSLTSSLLGFYLGDTSKMDIDTVTARLASKGLRSELAATVLACVWIEQMSPGDEMSDMLTKAQDWMRMESEMIGKNVEELRLSVQRVIDLSLSASVDF